MKIRGICLFILLSASACAPNNLPHGALFNLKLDNAFRILDRFPTGQKAKAGLQGQNAKNKPIEIVGLSTEEMTKHSGHNGGGIKKVNETGEYQILINNELTAEGLAQVLTHEFQHILDEYEEDAYLAQHPEVDARISSVAQAIKSGTLTTFQQSHQNDVIFFMKSIFYLEAKGYQVNFKLEQEGFPFDNAKVKQVGIATYVDDYYIKKYGFSFDSNAEALLTTVNNYSSLVEFQKSIL